MTRIGGLPDFWRASLQKLETLAVDRKRVYLNLSPAQIFESRQGSSLGAANNDLLHIRIERGGEGDHSFALGSDDHWVSDDVADALQKGMLQLFRSDRK